MKTITELEKILEDERKTAKNQGAFGLDECKKSIKWQMNFKKCSLEELYIELIRRGLTEWGFNMYMIVACEQMMNEISAEPKA